MEEYTGRIVDMERNIFCPSCHNGVVIKMVTPFKSERTVECQCGCKFWVENGHINKHLGRPKDDDT